MKNRIITLLITILLHCSLAYADDDKDFSLHGIRLGIDEEVLVEEYPEFNCEKDQSNSELRRCTAKFDPTSQPGVFEKLRGSTIDIHITFRKDKLVNINIPFYSVLFEPTSQFFSEQYGQPKVLQNSIKNIHGKEQKNTILQWTQGSESIIYWKIDEDQFKKDNTDEYSRVLFLLKE
jgi:hypothetical protein